MNKQTQNRGKYGKTNSYSSAIAKGLYAYLK